MIPVQVGSKIPLTLQVYDGRQDLKVTAVLLDSIGKEYARVELESVSKGLYSNFAWVMPDVDFLIAQYHTDSEDYELAQDIFKAVPKAQEPEKFLVGEVISKGQWQDEFIIGVVTNDDQET